MELAVDYVYIKVYALLQFFSEEEVIQSWDF